MSKYTPGPWIINTAGSSINGKPFKINEIYVYAPNTQDDTAICAYVIDPITQKPSEANARLISAAPDLLYALKLCRQYMYDHASNTPDQAFEKLCAAIEKAEYDI